MTVTSLEFALEAACRNVRHSWSHFTADLCRGRHPIHIWRVVIRPINFLGCYCETLGSIRRDFIPNGPLILGVIFQIHYVRYNPFQQVRLLLVDPEKNKSAFNSDSHA